MKHAKIVGFLSSKGGVGKTTTVANLGAVLAQDFGKKVLIVDANLTNANLALHFGFHKPKHTFQDVLAGKVRVEKALYEHESGMHLLPAAVHGKSVSYKRLRNYLTSLRPYYDLILVDGSPSQGDGLVEAVSASDEVFLLTGPDYVTLSATLKTLKLAQAKKTHISGLILNRVRGKKFELDVHSVQDHTRVPVVCVLKDDNSVLESLNKGLPVAMRKKRSDATVEYKKLAAALVGRRYEDGRLKTRLRKMVNKNLSPDEVNRAIVMVSHY